MSCVFCDIIAGLIPSTKVYEDEHVFAFLTIEPITKGHTLVIPKTHVKNILDCTPEVLANTMRGVQAVAKQMIENDATAVRIEQNNEQPFQQVFHLHFHVIPYQREE